MISLPSFSLYAMMFNTSRLQNPPSFVLNRNSFGHSLDGKIRIVPVESAYAAGRKRRFFLLSGIVNRCAVPSHSALNSSEENEGNKCVTIRDFEGFANAVEDYLADSPYAV